MNSFKASCIQLSCTSDIQSNLQECEGYIRQAAAQGAQYIATPENTCHIRHPAHTKIETAFTQEEHPAIPFFAQLASELNIWLLIGSLSILNKKEGNKLYNRSYLFSAQGENIASYDKIHLFDVELSSQETYKESEIFIAGEKPVQAKLPWGVVGLSICYDLRFAYLYRMLAQQGAQIFNIPAAFTVPTGKAHWDVLLRARAIETGSFVIAPAQTGTHENGRQTYGHSCIINPWGEIIAQADDEPGFIIADIALDEVEKARQSIPALKHDRYL